MIELNLWLDSYDDIYSDFDSRQYIKRRISEDFLHELRTEMKHKNDPADQLVLFLPSSSRDVLLEKSITESLADYFTYQYDTYKNKFTRQFHKGLLLLVSGIIIMLLNV
jgi:hypothetical protein